MVEGRFQKVEGSEFTLEADLVLLAMGFVGPEKLEEDGYNQLEQARIAPEFRTAPIWLRWSPWT